MTGTRFGIETIREAVRRRVAETSLRQVADEVPMSFSGLRSFLHGGSPQSATRGRLVAWYIQSRRKGQGRVRREDVDGAIALLRQYVREISQTTAREKRQREIIARIVEWDR